MRPLQIVSIAICWLLSATTSSAQEPARIALLIGNKGYTTKVGPLKNPHNDVTLIGGALGKLGFKVTTLRDADYRTMDSAIRRHVAEIRAAGKGTLSFFYYSGHGVANPDTQVNYLIPVDVADANDANIWFQSFEQSSIIDRLSQQAPNATHYVVFDACRNELNLTGPGAKALGAEKGFVPVSHASGLLIAYATAPKQTASDTGDRGGPYATILAEEMVKPNVEAVTMFRNVQIRVKQAIGQDPWLSFPSVPPVYLAGEPPKPAAPKAGPPLPSPGLVREAADAWGAVKDTTNVGLLEAFITRYRETFYAELARARISDLRKQGVVASPAKRNEPAVAKAPTEAKKPPEKQQVAVATPPAAEPKQQPSASKPAPVERAKPPGKKQIDAWRTAAQPMALKTQTVVGVDCCWSSPFVKKLASLSGGKIKIEVQEPGAVVPSPEQIDAVSGGRLAAGWGSPNYWVAKTTAFNVYSGPIALGHPLPRFVAWVRERGEAELNALYRRVGLKVQSLACGVEGAEGMWFKKPLSGIADLKGLRVRAASFPSIVIEKLGAKTQYIFQGTKVVEALASGTIDAAEFSGPAFDERTGFAKVVSHYYYPGFHSPAYLWELEVNLDRWNELSEAQKGLIGEACRQNIDEGLDDYEEATKAALQRIKGKGVQVLTFSNEVRDAVRTARDEIVQEYAAKDPEFKRAWESYISFR